MVVNEYVINTWCNIIYVVSCELCNNPIGIYLEKSFYEQY